VHERNTQTDGQTGLGYYGNTALCAKVHRAVKTRTPTEMPVAMWELSRVHQRHHDHVTASRSSMGRDNFDGKGMPRNARWHSAVSCAKTAEPIETSFRVVGWREFKDHALDGVQIPLCKLAISMGNDTPGNSRQHSAVSCAKMAETVDMPFGLWTRVGRRKHVLHDLHVGLTWRIRLNCPCAAMRPYVKLL